MTFVCVINTISGVRGLETLANAMLANISLHTPIHFYESKLHKYT